MTHSRRGAYRALLRQPGVVPLTLFMFLARLPLASAGLVLTLHVVTDLDRGYASAGLVGTATTVGSMVGSPLAGKALDRFGLRLVVAVAGVCSAAYWLSVPGLSYDGLLVVALPAGALSVPLTSVSRQVLTALVPEEHRRAALSLDTVLLEASFVLGPAVAVQVATRYSATTALVAIAVISALTSTVFFVRNPPLLSAADQEAAARSVERSGARWLTRPLVATLIITSGALFVLAGTELALVALLQKLGEAQWTGFAIGIMAVASAIGGLAHGAARRPVSQLTLVVLLAVLVVPAGFADRSWWLVSLALVPMQLACSPALAASVENVVRLAPPRARGVAMGLEDAATRMGASLGFPVVGLFLDRTTPMWGFVTAGVGGLLFAAFAAVLTPRPADTDAVPDPSPLLQKVNK